MVICAPASWRHECRGAGYVKSRTGV